MAADGARARFAARPRKRGARRRPETSPITARGDHARIALVLALGRGGNRFTKARFWEKHAGAAFNDRQRDMLNRLLSGFEGKLTTSKWAQIEKCSQDTALRDIGDLVARGILRKDPAGGRSTSYSLAGV